MNEFTQGEVMARLEMMLELSRQNVADAEVMERCIDVKDLSADGEMLIAIIKEVDEAIRDLDEVFTDAVNGENDALKGTN